MTTRRVVGCMTGTSIDGLDAALVEIEGSGLAMKAKVIRCVSRPLGAAATTLRMLAEQRPMIASEVTAAMHTFSMLHAAAIQEVLGRDRADLVCVHGQTVFHKPPFSWQLMQPAPIVAAIRCPVVYDLRQADLAVGGQGAPITPLADWILFRRGGDPMSVVNLGGFCNFTEWLTDLSPNEDFPQPWNKTLDIRGGDVCACNQVLDAIARKRLGCDYDQDGEVAGAGTQHDTAFESLRDLLQRQSAAGRSLGTGDELGAWMTEFSGLSGPDLLRSACEAIAEVIAGRLRYGMCRTLVAGGGAKNLTLLGAIRSRMRHGAMTTDEVGVPAAYREAACFAVLGALCQDKVPITLPAVTGVSKAPLSGAWVYP